MPQPPVLVVAPHALDEVLGCGGTIALHAAAGRKVTILVLCGDGSGFDGKRRAAAGEAAKLLRTEPPRFAGFPENRSDTVPLAGMVEAVERIVAELRPTTVYASHGGNLNVDHQNAFRATATAVRPLPDSPIAEFFGFEIPSSTDWAPPSFGEPFRPTRFVDISTVLARKLEALALYSFDMRAEPHARSIRAVENLSYARGASVGLKAAEAFTTLRTVLRT
ncbi:MAG TPA: PIG-L deacetylase family protein [Xanthobacteraceae bacterium]|nr:PIG-L deacetylase family protein [Xanthobacteraceae bacterium]